MTIYQNNSVEITSETHQFDTKILVNGDNLIWISTEQLDDFKKDISELLDNYRI